MPSTIQRVWQSQATAVLVVALAIVILWYGGSIIMNAQLQRDAFENADQKDYTSAQFIAGTLNMERPKLPAPHQIVRELDKTVLQIDPSSKRSLVYHGIVTLQATLLGFSIGSILGVLLAVLVVHAASLDKGLMPWIVASQAIPIIALAPMIVVILNQFEVTGIVPKAVISAYLSFFPVTVGMVKGLRSPDPLQLDLMRTYSASRPETLFKLRLPASVPFLFASLKVAVAASLVGAIVAEVTKSEDGGLGARLLAGSYYGQTVQIWAALIAAAICACVLIGIVGSLDRVVSRRMGYAR
ncbi:MAG: ABC transporter permease [Methylobacteriaceae bacterium]|nr:ABC transporter permease [Methylobacteriaceae bacterium]MBV9246676.1 ABC transporter permease [Methylobacteriaceae bacterium]MBV9635512.1 ABC transporter permease [Methylobacteriaceae bacterium]MBV9702381.1 ABC transporter permease [Methylobacteriaceae bacterium]